MQILNVMSFLDLFSIILLWLWNFKSFEKVLVPSGHVWRTSVPHCPSRLSFPFLIPLPSLVSHWYSPTWTRAGTNSSEQRGHCISIFFIANHIQVQASWHDWIVSFLRVPPWFWAPPLTVSLEYKSCSGNTANVSEVIIVLVHRLLTAAQWGRGFYWHLTDDHRLPPLWLGPCSHVGTSWVSLPSPLVLKHPLRLKSWLLTSPNLLLVTEPWLMVFFSFWLVAPHLHLFSLSWYTSRMDWDCPCTSMVFLLADTQVRIIRTKLRSLLIWFLTFLFSSIKAALVAISTGVTAANRSQHPHCRGFGWQVGKCPSFRLSRTALASRWPGDFLTRSYGTLFGAPLSSCNIRTICPSQGCCEAPGS